MVSVPYFISGHPGMRRLVKVLRAFGYAAAATAGVLILVVGHPPFGPWYEVMAGFAILGGALGTLSMLTGRWVEEFLGLPLVASAMICFGVLVWRDGSSLASRPAALILFAFGSLLVARWIDVFALALSSARLGRIKRHGDG